MRQVQATESDLVDMVFKSGYVVYRNHQPNDKTQEKAVDGEQAADTLEKEYEEKIRKANMEMRREHGDQIDGNETGRAEDADKKIEKVALTPDEMNGREAFFSLMAMKMMELSKKYQRKLHDIHTIFFMVSCDFQLLE